MTLLHIGYDSLVLMTIVNLLTTGSVMIFIWNADRPGPGLTRVACGDLLIGSGLLVSALGNLIPGGSVTLISNLAIFAGAISFLTGVRAFRGFRTLRVPLIAAASAIYAGPLIYWLLIHDDMPVRIAFSSGSSSTPCWRKGFVFNRLQF